MSCTYGTFLIGGGYLPGVVALARSLRSAGSAFPLTVFAVNVPASALRGVADLGLDVVHIPRLDPPDAIVRKNKAAGFARWNATFTKLRALGQTQFDKLVLLDADMMVVRNIDELFSMPHMSAVVAGQGMHPEWVDLNSGLVVIEPSEHALGSAMDLLYSLDDEALAGLRAIGDQDILKMLAPGWALDEGLHLSERYNLFQECLAPYARTGYLDPAEAAAIHFELSPKPWSYGRREWIGVWRRALRNGSMAEVRALRRYERLVASQPRTRRPSRGEAREGERC